MRDRGLSGDTNCFEIFLSHVPLLYMYIVSTVVLNNVGVFEKNMIFRSLVLNIEKLNQLQLGHP